MLPDPFRGANIPENSYENRYSKEEEARIHRGSEAAASDLWRWPARRLRSLLRSHGVRFEKKDMDARQEDDQTDSQRTDCSQQHAAGCDILGPPDQGMKFLGCCITKQLEGGIQCLGRPNRGHGQDDPAPFGRSYLERKTGHNNDEGRERVYPGIVLRTKQMENPRKRIFEASDPPGEHERTAL
jgi:hypothetical protein